MDLQPRKFMGELKGPAKVTKGDLKELFHHTQLFQTLPDEQIDELVRASTFANYMPEDIILEQGENNKDLYFLVLGTVDIYVDGGRVATLTRKGDLLGEMSVISHKAISATIMASTPVQLLKIDTDKLQEMAPHEREHFEHVLYRIYSLVLADKLNITNDRAKKLEDILEALSRTKMELQEINRTMEVRVAERTASMQQNLENLLKKHLMPLQDSLGEVKENLPEEKKESLQNCLGEVQGVIRYLEPLTSTFKSALSIKNKKVLIVDSQRKQQLIAKMALGGTGVKLVTALDMEEARSRLEWDIFDLVIADIGILDALELARSRNPEGQYVVMTSESAKESIPKLRALPWQPDIIGRDDEDRTLTTRNIMTTVTKLLSANIFGLEKYLNWGVDIQEMPVANSVDRHYVRTEMANYFQELGVRRSILSNVDMVAEELLMNAIYDAPTDATGNSLYNHISRKEEIELKPDQQARFRYGFDGEYVAISIEDPFGGLKLATIFDYLESCYSGEAGKMNEEEEKGGAGRGLHQIVENSTAVIFNVSPRVRTEVVALFHAVPGDKRERPRQIHYFTQRGKLEKV